MSRCWPNSRNETTQKSVSDIKTAVIEHFQNDIAIERVQKKQGMGLQTAVPWDFKSVHEKLRNNPVTNGIQRIQRTAISMKSAGDFPEIQASLPRKIPGFHLQISGFNDSLCKRNRNEVSGIKYLNTMKIQERAGEGI
jgi:hypothetical protein